MTCYLYEGIHDAKVFMIQDYLKVRGYYVGYKTDGYYGKYTASEVRRFQKDHGLTVDGCVGCESWNAICYPPCPWAVTPTPTPAPEPTDNTYVSPRYYAKKQETNYWCAPSMEQQGLYELFDVKVPQSELASRSGTGTSGTDHPGIVNAVKAWASANGHSVDAGWQNFSATGWDNLGKMISDPNVFAGIHCLYKDRWGHYMSPIWLSTSKQIVGFVNSLSGDDFSYYDFGTVQRWINETPGNQPSVFRMVKKG